MFTCPECGEPVRVSVDQHTTFTRVNPDGTLEPEVATHNACMDVQRERLRQQAVYVRVLEACRGDHQQAQRVMEVVSKDS